MRRHPIAHLIRESRGSRESEHGAQIRVSVHISYLERHPTTISCWLGRKDSNLQPSDPESAALPLRHSPNLLSRGLHCSSYCLAFGAVLQSVGRRQIVADFVMSSLGRSRCRPSEAPRFFTPRGASSFGPNPSLRLLPGDDDVRLLGTLRPHSHPNRERFAGPHQPAERVLHQRLRAVQVDRPTDPENPVAE
jgi:hypothetical protein